MRRRKFYYNINVNISDLLSGNIIHDSKMQDVLDNYTLEVYEDRNNYEAFDMIKVASIINEYYPRRSKIIFHNLFTNSYDELLRIVSNNKLSNVSIFNMKDNDGKKLFEFNNQDDRIPYDIYITEEDICELPLKFYSKINTSYGTVKCYDRKIMSDEDFVYGIKFIADQINYYAKNDIQKVLLLDKMLRKNVKYDEYFYYVLRQDMPPFEACFDQCHKAQTVLRDRCAVCNAISYFALYVLSNLGIKCKTIKGKASNEGHMWNEIELQDKWFSNDFTHSLWFDRESGTKYTLVSRPSLFHSKDEGNFDELYTVDRNYLKKQMDEIKNIDIKMPEYPYMDYTRYNQTLDYKNRIYNRRNNNGDEKIVMGHRRTPSVDEAKKYNEEIMNSIKYSRRHISEISSFSTNDDNISPIGQRRNMREISSFFTDDDNIPPIGRRRLIK